MSHSDKPIVLLFPARKCLFNRDLNTDLYGKKGYLNIDWNFEAKFKRLNYTHVEANMPERVLMILRKKKK